MTGSSGAFASVVIPAHNEQGVLTRCLEALVGGQTRDELEVIVAANGCNDATVAIARRYEDRGVRVVETAEASKVAALNLGDSAAHAMPRVYLDADVVVDLDAVKAMCAALCVPNGPLAVAPRMRVVSDRSSRSARAYMQVWESLPVFDSSYVGSGCYALSDAGRRAFDRFPNVVGDDRFVNDLFARHERMTLHECEMLVFAPLTLRAIVRRSIRVRAGTDALAERAERTSSVHIETSGGTRRHLLTLLGVPGRRIGVVVFVGVQLWVRAVARVRARAGKAEVWLRDETSRT